MSSQPMYRVLELAFAGPKVPVPAGHPPLNAVFRHQEGAEIAVSGFWDGGDRYVVRFAPEREGRWRWVTSSREISLDGIEGSFTVLGADGRGPVRTANTYHFVHADGTPFRPVGTTVYNWLHQDDGLFAETLDAVATAGFTKLRFMVLPQAGRHVERFPDVLPFERRSDGGWDVSRPVVAFFRRLDDAVARLGARGVQADVLIFTAYDGGHFGFDRLTEEEDAAYLRYLVARLSAYPNVWWSLCNEFDLLADRPPERWDRMGELLAEIDSHRHLRSIHNWMELHDHNQSWVTHASIQNGQAVEEFGRAGIYRDTYRKPVVLDEIKYEGDVPERWGHLTAEELVHRFWVATVSGCYASHGESFLRGSGSLHIVEGGRFTGASPERLAFLRRILDELEVPGLDPVDKWDDPAFVAGVARWQYVQYFGRSAPAEWAFRLPQASTVGERLRVGDTFEVDVIDTWGMTVTPVGRRFVLTDVHRNDAFAVDAAPIALPEGRPIALRITRVP